MILNAQQIRAAVASGEILVKPGDFAVVTIKEEPFQGKTELRSEDIEMITEGSGIALSEILTTLGSLSSNVGTLTEDVSRLAYELKSLKYVIPLIMSIGLTIIALIVRFS